MVEIDEYHTGPFELSFRGLKFRLMKMFKIRNPTQGRFLQDDLNQVHLFYCTMKHFRALLAGNVAAFVCFKLLWDVYSRDSEAINVGVSVLELLLFIGCQWYSVAGVNPLLLFGLV